MEQLVFLIVGDDEVFLGTVDEVTERECGGTLLAAVADIVSDLAADPIETCQLLAIELR